MSWIATCGSNGFTFKPHVVYVVVLLEKTRYSNSLCLVVMLMVEVHRPYSIGNFKASLKATML